MEWLDAIASRDEPAAAGVACALTCATAAALVELTAPLAANRLESAGDGSEATAMRALGTGAGEQRAAALRAAGDDARAYAAVTEASSDAARAAALERASEPPLAIAEAAGAVATAAGVVAAAGDWPFTPDAVVACELASTAARCAAGLVAANLSDPQDPRRRRARDAVDRAAAARDRLTPGG
jgi:formiminotetrahydrofolate cyclodeaminase